MQCSRLVLQYLFLWSTTDRKSTRLNSSHLVISYAVFCLKNNLRFHGHHLRSLVPAHAAGRGAALVLAPFMSWLARAAPLLLLCFSFFFFFFFSFFQAAGPPGFFPPPPRRRRPG